MFLLNDLVSQWVLFLVQLVRLCEKEKPQEDQFPELVFANVKKRQFDCDVRWKKSD